MKAITCAFIIILIFTISATTLNTRSAKASTEVTGIIASDTTWTTANSPYNFTGRVGVSDGTTLTIQPGVIVNFGDYDLQVDGTLVARGTKNSQIFFNAEKTSSLTFADSSNDWNEQTATGSIIENTNLSRFYIRANMASPKITNNNIDGSILIHGGSPTISHNTIAGRSQSGSIEVEAGSPVISHNTITSETGYLNYPLSNYGINLEGGNKVYISDNIIVSRFASGGIYVGGDSATIERNLITDKGPNGVGMRIQGYVITRPLIQKNTIVNNQIGLSIRNFPSPTIINNNIHDNSEYNVYVGDEHNTGPAGGVNATYNWWGTTNATTISETIFDFDEDFTMGKVEFIPFLTSPNSEAPVATPSPTPSPTPTSSPTPTITPETTLTPTPTQEPQQAIPNEILLGAVIVIAVVSAGIGLFLYLIKKN